MNAKNTTLILIIFVTILSRFIPHPPNFTPVLAAGLFAGTYLQRKYLAFILPAIIMLVTDAFIGFHPTMIWVYLALIFVVGIGMLVSRKKNLFSVICGGVSSAFIFYLISNFGVWMTSGGYSHPISFPGLIACYIDGLPFFKYTLLSTTGFYAVSYLTYEKISKNFAFEKINRSELLS